MAEIATKAKHPSDYTLDNEPVLDYRKEIFEILSLLVDKVTAWKGEEETARG